MYEYYDRSEREQAVELNLELEADKIEEEREQETLDWIEEEERREREAEEEHKKQEAEEEKWMLEQLKKEYGDDFGEDIDTDFQ